MHPKIEILEKLFSEAKNHSASIENFFDELWKNGGTLPRPEMRNVVERVNEYVKTDLPLTPKNLALAQLALGFVAFHEGNYEKSLPELIKAQKLFTDIHDENGVQAAGVMLGCDYRTLGELELALKCLLDAYPLLSKTSDYKMFLIFCIYNLAEIYSETGQYEEALRFHQITIKVTEEALSKNMKARTLNGIAVVYQHLKNYSLALDYLMQSLKLSEEINNRPVKARTLTDLGVYYFEMGDYAKATDYQNQALNIRNELKIPNGAVTNLVHLAEIFIKQNNPDKAIELLTEAMKIAEEIKVKTKVYQIHEMLSGIYQSKGDLLTSLFHYKAFYNIREEVQREDNQKKIKNLQLIFEAEQTKKENVIIKAQKQEIENKNQQLQETIDELTITKVSRKAKGITLFVGIALIIAEDPIMDYVLRHIGEGHFLLSITAKIIIIFSLKPIDTAIEGYLLRRLVLKKRKSLYEKSHKNPNDNQSVIISTEQNNT